MYWGSEIKKEPPSVPYDEIMASDAGVGKWTSKIVRHYPILIHKITDQSVSVSTDSAS